MSATWLYLACDIQTGAVIDELPLRNASFETSLDAAGSWSATLPLAQDGARFIAASNPSKTIVYALRNNVPMGAGILWTRRWSSGSQSVEIGGAETFSYFGRRTIRDPLSYSGVDQFTIVRNLITYAQGKTNGNIGMAVSSGASGITKSLTAYSYERRKVGEAIQQFADQDNGFDFYTQLAYDPATGLPSHTLTLANKAGRVLASSNVVFDLPGQVLSLNYPEDGASQANNIYGTSGSLGSAQSGTSTGYPLLEDTVSFEDQQSQSDLDGRTRAEVAARRLPLVVPEVDIDLFPLVPFVDFNIGDECRLVQAPNPRFSTGSDITKRITGIAVAGGDSDSRERVTLTLVDP